MGKRLFVLVCLIPIFSVSAHGEALKDFRAPLYVYPRLPYKELIFPSKGLLPSHAPSIVELPDGELLTAWYAATIRSPYAAIWGSRRPAGASRWTAPKVINSTPGRSNKNPVLYLNRDKKLVLFWSEEIRWFKWKRDILRMKVSVDLGNTWGEARNVGRISGFLPKNHPTELRDGRVILPLYMDWNTSSAAALSDDGGMTWGKPVFMLFLLGIQPTIIQRSDTTLFALTRTGMWPRFCWQVGSDNSGLSWKDPKLSNVKNPGSCIEMIKLASGNVALVFNDSRKERDGLTIALSFDEGRTWPCTRLIEYRPGRIHTYPSIMQDRHGLIHVVYSYDNRNGIVHFVTDEKWIKEGR